MDRELFLTAAFDRLGCPYKWGSNGPDAFDCSGYVLHCLRAAGADLPDMNSTTLAERLRSCRVEAKDALPGSIWFYGSPRVHHVMLCLRRWPDGHLVLAGARGGNETTTDYEIAYGQRAMVSVVAGDYWRKELSLVVDPFCGEFTC